MKIKPDKSAQPAFVRRAARALRRAGLKVRQENARLGLPLLVWDSAGKPLPSGRR